MVSKRAKKSDIPAWVILLGLCFLLIVVLGFLKTLILKQALLGLGPQVIGARIEVNHVSVSLLRQRISVKGLKVHNPSGFSEEIFLDVPEISVAFKPWRMLGGRLYMSEVVVNMREFVVIKNQDKKLNVDALKIANSNKDTTDIQDKTQAERPKFFIEVLRLNLERVVVKDYSKGENPIVKVHDLPLKEKTFHDIDSVEKLVMVLIVQGMGPTAIKGAGIYAAAAVLGVGLLPAGVLGVIVADDDAVIQTHLAKSDVFDLCLDFIAKRGTLKKQHRQKGLLQAKINGHDIRIDIRVDEESLTQIRVTARKFMIPKPAFAAGIVYQLEEDLNH